MRHQKLSSAEEGKEGLLIMNVEVDREHYEKLLILSTLWKRGTPRSMVEGVVDDFWTQLPEFVPGDLSPEDFAGIVAYLEEPEG